MQAQQLLANPLLCNTLIRDVKTVYFWEPATGLPKPVFTGYRKAYYERDNCHQSLCSALAISQITCCFTATVARIPDARAPTP